MSRTRKAKHKPRCGLCHPDKLDGNSLKNANRAEVDRRGPPVPRGAYEPPTEDVIDPRLWPAVVRFVEGLPTLPEDEGPEPEPVL